MRAARPIVRSGLIAAVLLAGCSEKPADTPNAVAPSAVNAADAAPSNATNAAPASNAAISFEEGKVEFHYGWPAQAAGIAELDAWLRGNAERLRKETMAGARNEEKAAKETGYDFPGYSYSEDWHSVADLDRLLVLQSEGYTYTGGAHGMPIVTTLFWDKPAKKRLATSAIFDMPALANAIRPRFCKALDAERAKRRGAPVDPNEDSPITEFVRCVDPAKQTILPVSLKGKAFDTIRVVIMPYEAGPYAEGIYEIDLPVDASVLRAVKADYKGAFGA